MIQFGADENFNLLIVRGFKRRKPALDILVVQDVGLRAVDDPGILAWAAAEARVMLTHDIRTMPSFAMHRIASG